MIHRNSAWAVLATAALAITSLTAAPTGAADPPPASPGPVANAGRLDPRGHVAFDREHPKAFRSEQRATNRRAAYFVRFTGDGAVELATQERGRSRKVATVRARRAEVGRIASRVLTATRRADRGATSLFTVANAVPGAGLLLTAAGADAARANPAVAEVARIVPKTAELQSSASLVKAVNVWNRTNNTGKGVTIGIIDTGVDYTHADFGGVGTIAGYDAAHAQETSPSWHQTLPRRAKQKFAGGYDFVGDSYDADTESPTYQPVPHTDNNPLDCNGHGSHVAGIAAGYGVTASGQTVRGSQYRKLDADKLFTLRIGPGMAPKARIFPLRVFGCNGPTNLVIPALDRALDPNGDGSFEDHLDVINASLGSDYGSQDDPENEVINVLAAHGVVPALSIGNNGDLTDTGGSPGNATASIASASSVDKLDLLDQLRVNAPAAVAGLKIGQMSVDYDWVRNGPTRAPVTGAVAALTQAGNEDGCAPLDAADTARVAGRIAWLEWDDNDATRECGSAGRSQNVQDAGAIGAILTSSLEIFSAGISGDPDIPVFQLTRSGSDQLRPFAQAMTLNVTLDGKLQASFERITPGTTDTLSGFSSRGPHGRLGVVKPDVTAPGETIGSAGVGSGDRVAVISGTSMASPHTAGVAALVLAEHPGWSPLRVKAAIMNTARHDLWTGRGRTGHRYGPARVGAGRLDARAAVGTRLLAWTKGPHNPVTASFGVVPAPVTGDTISRIKTIVVKNLNKKDIRVRARYRPIVSQPGVSYSVTPSRFSLRKGGTKEINLRMTVDPAALRHTIDPTMEVDQLGVPRQFLSDASGRVLVKQRGRPADRVPVYGAAKPTSDTTVRSSDDTLTITGTGFDTGDSRSDWRSLLSVTEFGTSSPVLPSCAAPSDPPIDCANTTTDRGSDIQYVGAGSNADWLWFGMSTHTDWTNLVLNIPDFRYDIDGNLANGPEFETFVTPLEATDVFVAVTVNLATGDEDPQPVNFNFGDVDTNVFDNNVVVLPVDKAFIGLTAPGSHPIVYEAANVNISHPEDAYADIARQVTYDAGTPNVATAEPLYLDDGPSTIALTGVRATDAKALILHLHGARGHRAEVVDVPALP